MKVKVYLTIITAVIAAVMMYLNISSGIAALWFAIGTLTIAFVWMPNAFVEAFREAFKSVKTEAKSVPVVANNNVNAISPVPCHMQGQAMGVVIALVKEISDLTIQIPREYHIATTTVNKIRHKIVGLHGNMLIVKIWLPKNSVEPLTRGEQLGLAKYLRFYLGENIHIMASDEKQVVSITLAIT